MDTGTELAAIRRLKYASFRTLDLKQFDQLGQLLTVDATASYEDYADRYAKTGEGWRIAHTGHVRVFEEHCIHSTLAVRSFTSRFGAPDS
jgi:hypothetical protein